jgi:hypothetical protein
VSGPAETADLQREIARLQAAVRDQAQALLLVAPGIADPNARGLVEGVAARMVQAAGAPAPAPAPPPAGWRRYLPEPADMTRMLKSTLDSLQFGAPEMANEHRARARDLLGDIGAWLDGMETTAPPPPPGKIGPEGR